MSPAQVAAFVARMKTERAERGLPPTIVDADALKLIAALIGTGTDRRCRDAA